MSRRRLDAELVGNDLCEDGEVPLPLRADAGRDIDLAVRLHLHLGAFIGPDAGALDIAGDADANMAALRRLALGLLKNDVSKKVGIKNKRLVAAWNIDYLQQVLFGA